MPIAPDVLATLAATYAQPMTSIRGRRVVKLLKREFAGADHVLLTQAAHGGAAVLGVSAAGAALCVTDGRGAEAPIFRWAHGSSTVLQTCYDLHKDSLPVVSTGDLAFDTLRARGPWRVSPGALPSPTPALVARVFEALA